MKNTTSLLDSLRLFQANRSSNLDQISFKDLMDDDDIEQKCQALKVDPWLSHQEKERLFYEVFRKQGQSNPKGIYKSNQDNLTDLQNDALKNPIQQTLQSKQIQKINQLQISPAGANTQIDNNSNSAQDEIHYILQFYDQLSDEICQNNHVNRQSKNQKNNNGIKFIKEFGQIQMSCQKFNSNQYQYGDGLSSVYFDSLNILGQGIQLLKPNEMEIVLEGQSQPGQERTKNIENYQLSEAIIIQEIGNHKLNKYYQKNEQKQKRRQQYTSKKHQTKQTQKNFLQFIKCHLLKFSEHYLENHDINLMKQILNTNNIKAFDNLFKQNGKIRSTIAEFMDEKRLWILIQGSKSKSKSKYGKCTMKILASKLRVAFINQQFKGWS